MATNKIITVEIAYAKAEQECLITLHLEANSTLETAIQHSGILTLFPEIDLHKQKVGVFGKPRKLTDKLENGDRVEIYRPLTIDPKEARRSKAKMLAKKRK